MKAIKLSFLVTLSIKNFLNPYFIADQQFYPNSLSPISGLQAKDIYGGKKRNIWPLSQPFLLRASENTEPCQKGTELYQKPRDFKICHTSKLSTVLCAFQKHIVLSAI